MKILLTQERVVRAVGRLMNRLQLREMRAVMRTGVWWLREDAGNYRNDFTLDDEVTQRLVRRMNEGPLKKRNLRLVTYFASHGSMRVGLQSSNDKLTDGGRKTL